jgi:hypothetical protein
LGLLLVQVLLLVLVQPLGLLWVWVLAQLAVVEEPLSARLLVQQWALVQPLGQPLAQWPQPTAWTAHQPPARL